MQKIKGEMCSMGVFDVLLSFALVPVSTSVYAASSYISELNQGSNESDAKKILRLIGKYGVRSLFLLSIPLDCLWLCGLTIGVGIYCGYLGIKSLYNKFTHQ